MVNVKYEGGAVLELRQMDSVLLNSITNYWGHWWKLDGRNELDWGLGAMWSDTRGEERGLKREEKVGTYGPEREPEEGHKQGCPVPAWYAVHQEAALICTNTQKQQQQRRKSYVICSWFLVLNQKQKWD